MISVRPQQSNLIYAQASQTSGWARLRPIYTIELVASSLSDYGCYPRFFRLADPTVYSDARYALLSHDSPMIQCMCPRAICFQLFLTVRKPPALQDILD